VEYLGHVMQPGRVHVLEKNIRALRGPRFPTAQTHMKSFLGMCSVNRRFVTDVAKIAKQLTAPTSTKLSKKLPPPSGKDTDACKILRGRLLDAPILALPRRHGHYIVDVDASSEQRGCCLQQKQSDGEYNPISYYSRALLPAEKNYFATEIEALGVVSAVSYLRSYRECAEFVIRCYHSAFLSIVTKKSPNARINRSRLRLLEYNYEIRHKPGKDHKVADALSHLPTEGLGTSPLDEDVPVLAVKTRSSDAIKEASPEEAPTGALSARDIILGQAEVAFCQARHKELDALPRPDPTWSRQAFFFREKNGLLCRRSILERSRRARPHPVVGWGRRRRTLVPRPRDTTRSRGRGERQVANGPPCQNGAGLRHGSCEAGGR